MLVELDDLVRVDPDLAAGLRLLTAGLRLHELDERDARRGHALDPVHDILDGPLDGDRLPVGEDDLGDLDVLVLVGNDPTLSPEASSIPLPWLSPPVLSK
jgi:hypothetical protein